MKEAIRALKWLGSLYGRVCQACALSRSAVQCNKNLSRSDLSPTKHVDSAAHKSTRTLSIICLLVLTSLLLPPGTFCMQKKLKQALIFLHYSTPSRGFTEAATTLRFLRLRYKSFTAYYSIAESTIFFTFLHQPHSFPLLYQISPSPPLSLSLCPVRTGILLEDKI